MKKILITIPSLRYGGTEFVLVEIINYLINKNYKIYLYTDFSSEIKDHRGLFGKQIIFLQSSNNFFKRCFKLYYYLKKFEIETIFALQSGIIISYVINLFFFKKLKIIGRLSTIISQQFKQSSYPTKIKLIIFLFCLSKISLIITQSKNMKQDLIQIFNKFNYDNKSIIKVIYNPVNINDIIEKSKIESSITNRNFIFYFGRIEKVKNLENLIILYYKSKLFLSYELLIMGDGTELNKIKKLTKKIKIKRYVKFLNFSMNPYSILSKCKIFILPSNYEGYSNSLIQSIILKKNILVSKSEGGNKEILGKYYPLLSYDFSSTLNPLTFKKKVDQIIETYDCGKKNILFNKIQKRHKNTLKTYLTALNG